MKNIETNITNELRKYLGLEEKKVRISESDSLGIVQYAKDLFRIKSSSLSFFESAASAFDVTIDFHHIDDPHFTHNFTNSLKRYGVPGNERDESVKILGDVLKDLKKEFKITRNTDIQANGHMDRMNEVTKVGSNSVSLEN